MDEYLRELHLAAGRNYGQDATCGAAGKLKLRHSDEGAAARAADSLNRSGKARNKVEPYPCPWCGLWHVGREMTQGELMQAAQLPPSPD
jgi:hypothetical protein